jgi:predicted RNA-binding protein YlqC (UPF0109 family)
MPAEDAIAQMVTRLGRALVDDPDAVSVDIRDERDRLVFELAVPEDQRGQVIGRGGRVAHALRTVTQAAGRAQGVRVGLDIVD